jgi:hypothetical protein
MKTLIRGLKSYSSVEADLKSTEGGILYTAPIQMQWTAKGYGWEAMNTGALAALVVRPSTTSMITLYNNSAKNFVIERAFAHNLVAVALSDFNLWLCVHPVGMTAPAGNNITVRNSLSGLAAGTEGVMDTAEAVTDNGWFPWGESGKTATVTTPGGSINAPVNGRIILPPTAGISVQVVSITTSSTFTVGLHWFSVPITEFAVG